MAAALSVTWRRRPTTATTCSTIVVITAAVAIAPLRNDSANMIQAAGILKHRSSVRYQKRKRPSSFGRHQPVTRRRLDDEWLGSRLDDIETATDEKRQLENGKKKKKSSKKKKGKGKGTKPTKKPTKNPTRKPSKKSPPPTLTPTLSVPPSHLSSASPSNYPSTSPVISDHCSQFFNTSILNEKELLPCQSDGNLTFKLTSNAVPGDEKLNFRYEIEKKELEGVDETGFVLCVQRIIVDFVVSELFKEAWQNRSDPSGECIFSDTSRGLSHRAMQEGLMKRGSSTCNENHLVGIANDNVDFQSRVSKGKCVTAGRENNDCTFVNASLLLLYDKKYDNVDAIRCGKTTVFEAINADVDARDHVGVMIPLININLLPTTSPPSVAPSDLGSKPPTTPQTAIPSASSHPSERPSMTAEPTASSSPSVAYEPSVTPSMLWSDPPSSPPTAIPSASFRPTTTSAPSVQPSVKPTKRYILWIVLTPIILGVSVYLAQKFCIDQWS
mmetsp:Transcript_9240/g.19779  ORF Transcript_9240/g.19779 Transcript_9240/m.19779 type:complete len:499 (-) Transcript_9240:250-1746(-)